MSTAFLSLSRRDVTILTLAIVASVLSVALPALIAAPVLSFVVSAAALALLATLVGRATEQLGTRVGPGATGVLQSALGNLPELFVGIFSLRAGLVKVVQAALVGSILANLLLVLGLALLFGGLRNGTQHFSSRSPRLTATLLVLSIATLAIPTLASRLHLPAAPHSDAFDIVCSVILLVLFAASIPFFVKGDPAARRAGVHDSCAELARNPEAHTEWALWLTIVVLVIAGLGSAVVADRFVDAITPTIARLGISEAFTGLVIVAIAGNAVENVVGVKLAIQNQLDYAMSIILMSSLQVALALGPVLVLLSYVIGGAVLPMVLPPLLVVAMALAAGVATLIVYDGESSWLEGAALLGLYAIIATAFWWG